MYDTEKLFQALAGLGIGFMIIGLAAMVLAFFMGTFLGITAALRQNTRADYSLMGVAMLGISLPSFVIAPILILLLAVYARWLPAGGWDWSIASMVLPVGEVSKLPVAVGLMGLPQSEAALIQMAYALEQAVPPALEPEFLPSIEMP